MLKAKKVTKWFIRKNPYLSSGFIDENTKINKLLYFSNLFSYAVLGEKMIEDEFVAFPNGPVVYDIYRDYRYNGLNSFPQSDIKVNEKYEKLLEIVNFVYGNRQKDDLVNISHSHNLWKDVEQRIPHNPPILFENATEDLLEKCRNIYKTYENVDFSKIKTEYINGNVYYYDIDNISELNDEIINKLMELPPTDEAQFIEIYDGELILS